VYPAGPPPTTTMSKIVSAFVSAKGRCSVFCEIPNDPFYAREFGG
jgi:hypothetical protein